MADPPAEPPRTRFRDVVSALAGRLVAVGVVAHLGLALFYVVTGRGSEAVARWAAFPSPPLLVFVVGLFLWAAQPWLRQSRTSAPGVFWGYLAAGTAFWAMAEVLRRSTIRLVPSPDPGSLAADALYLAGDLSFLFAVDIVATSAHRSRERSEQLGLVGAVVFLLSLLVYFVYIPRTLSPAEIEVWHSSDLLQIGLDLFLAWRFAAAAARWRGTGLSRHLRWGFLAFAMAFLVDLSDYLAVLGLPAPTTERWPGGLLSLLPFLPLVLGAAGSSISGFDPVGSGARPVPRRPRFPGALVFYAVALPTIHLLLLPYATPEVTTRRAREVLVVVHLVGLAALAMAQYARREQARREAEAALAESETRYRRLVEASPDAIIVVQEGRATYGNATARRFWGEAELVGRDLAAFGLADPETDEVSVADSLSRLGGDADPRDVEVRWRPIVFGGRPAWQGVVRDVTLVESLRRRRRRAERLATLGELAGRLGETLRAPLDRLRSGVERLRPLLGADEAQTVEDLDLAVHRMDRIVDGMRSLRSSSTSGLPQQEVSVILDLALRSLAPALEASRTTIIRDLGHRAATPAIDGHQLLQVFTNLIENAVQAAGPGGRVAVRTADRSGGLELRVEDSGPGIAAEVEDRMFDPFFTTREGGTGLGLAVVSRILDRHGCSFGVERRDDRTSFRILFPPAETMS